MMLLFFIIQLQILAFGEEPIQLRQITSEKPSGFNIIDPQPNTFSPVTNYKLEFPDSALIKIDIYQGNVHLVKYQKQLPPGAYSAQWNLNDSQGERVLIGVHSVKIQIISTVRDTKFIHSHSLTLAL